MDFTISFPGGKRVDASVGDFTIRTDQPASAGGDGSAPEPFTLFLASIGTCAGIYVLGFCQARNIPTDGITLHQHTEKDASGRLTRVDIEVRVPASFPAEYRDAVARAANFCKVKKTIIEPPEFRVTTAVA